MCLLVLACFPVIHRVNHKQSRDLFFAAMRALIPRIDIGPNGFLAMTTRIMLLSAVSIAVGSSLAYGSPGCMTKSEARAKFPKAQHLYWHGSKHCWNDSAAYSFRALAVVPLASPRRALAAVPSASTRRTPTPSTPPEVLKPTSRTEEAGPQCQLPCE